MQSPEFDKLMKNQQAMWAELGDKPNLTRLLKGDELSVVEKQQEIAKEETPIPQEIQSAIHKFIEEQKKLGTKSRTIRRMVKRKWNIEVI